HGNKRLQQRSHHGTVAAIRHHYLVTPRECVWAEPASRNLCHPVAIYLRGSSSSAAKSTAGGAAVCRATTPARPRRRRGLVVRAGGRGRRPASSRGSDKPRPHGTSRGGVRIMSVASKCSLAQPGSDWQGAGTSRAKRATG